MTSSSSNGVSTRGRCQPDDKGTTRRAADLSADSTSTLQTPNRQGISQLIIPSKSKGGLRSKHAGSAHGNKPHRQGTSNSLLANDYVGYEDSSPQTGYSEYSHHPRRYAHEESGHEGIAFMTQFSHDPSHSLSRTSLQQGQTLIPPPRAPGYTRSRCNSSVPDFAETWSSASSEVDSKSQQKPMRRPQDSHTHTAPCWLPVHDWDQRNESEITVGNIATAAAYYPLPRRQHTSSNETFLYADNGGAGAHDWQKPSMTASFNSFPHTQATLHVPNQRSCHSATSAPQDQSTNNPNGSSTRYDFPAGNPYAHQDYMSQTCYPHITNNGPTLSARTSPRITQQQMQQTLMRPTPPSQSQVPQTYTPQTSMYSQPQSQAQAQPQTPMYSQPQQSQPANIPVSSMPNMGQLQPHDMIAHTGLDYTPPHTSYGTLHSHRAAELNYHNHGIAASQGAAAMPMLSTVPASISASTSNTSANGMMGPGRRLVRPPASMLVNAAITGVHLNRGRTMNRHKAHARRPTSTTRMHHYQRLYVCPHRGHGHHCSSQPPHSPRLFPYQHQ